MRFFKRFSNCALIKGYKSFTIYDITRNDVFAIDKTTFELLGEDIIKEESLLKLPNNCFNELLEKEIIFQCKKGDEILFPPLNLEWYSPFTITSSIIDWGKDSQYDIIKAIDQLDIIGCKTLQLRFEPEIQGGVINSILETIVGKNIRSVELIFFFNDELLNKIASDYEFIMSIIAYGTHENLSKKINGCQVILTEEMFVDSKQCGEVSPSYFACNKDYFFESLNHNTCLNGKVSLDVRGNIKNCPSCVHAFGNINDTTLKQALTDPYFKKRWNITKDQIDVCKDCEFRHMCTDCRVFIKDPENIYSQPAKCTYNPYIAKWQGEEGYVPVEECGKYSKEKGFIINKEIVDSLNLKLWNS